MKRALLLAAALSVLSALAFAPAASAAVDHCPEPYLVKVEGPSPNHVPSAGTELCVKAGTGNTGRIVADGTTTLRGYLKAAGIVGGDGEGRDPSYAVTYHLEVTPFPTTTTTITTPSPAPTTTTTTLRRTTPTTSAPDSPVSTSTPNLGCVTPEGHPYVTNIERGGCSTATNPTSPAPTTAPTARTELPRTGWGETLLVFVGLWFLLGGITALALAQLIRGAK